MLSVYVFYLYQHQETKEAVVFVIVASDSAARSRSVESVDSSRPARAASSFLVPKPDALAALPPTVQSYVFSCNGCNLINK